jgi:hypothetical protein
MFSDPDTIRDHLARWSEPEKMFSREQVVIALDALDGGLASAKVDA